ncbi:MAG: hypothetical protein IT535_14440, partial [Bauldia sp.]|nr:hypothetical protein [Bauldia sp.]
MALGTHDSQLTQPSPPPARAGGNEPLRLAFGLAFEDLYSRAGAERLDGLFLEFLAKADPALVASLEAGRADPAKLAVKEESELIIAVAPHLEDFVGELFGIRGEIAALQAEHHR